MPVILINDGADGVASGWKTEVSTFHPLDIIANIRLLMDGKEMNEITPVRHISKVL